MNRLPPRKSCTAVFLCLSAFRLPVFGLFLSGKLVGGLFQPYYLFELFPHGFHIHVRERPIV